jgi:anaerobic selenocysteine-containing dehydrogenase
MLLGRSRFQWPGCARRGGQGTSVHSRGLCAKVSDYERYTYASDRVLYPLRRKREKGGVFERISWEVALSEIAERFSKLIAEFGPECLLPVNAAGSMGVVQRRALMRIFNAIGASTFHGTLCGAAANVIEAEGHPRGFDPEEAVESRFVLLWGANLLSTSHHHWHFLKEARKRHGARIVCIDPMRTRTASACDEHISIRPGSDAVLAAGLAHLMFADGLVDEAFLLQVASDTDALRQQVAPWTPGKVAETCEIEAATVVRIAREFAAARPALIRCGIAPQQTAGGEDLMRTLSALAIMGGHWRLAGGGLFSETAPKLDESRAARPDLRPREPRDLDIARLSEHLTSKALSPPIMGLMIWGANPAVGHPNANRVREGLLRTDLFTVVIEHFLTDSARLADVVLPSTTQLEHFDVQGAWGHHYISVNNPAVRPLAEAKSHGEIMRLLARRLNLDHPAFRESDEQIASSVLPPCIELESLKANGWYKSSPPRHGFGPERGKLRLSSGVRPPPMPPAPGMLQLLTPKSHYFLNSSFANMPRQRNAMRRPTLEMHPRDARARELVDGARVVVRNGVGQLHAWLQVNDGVHPGVVLLPGKWWRVPEETAALANLLTSSEWTAGGQPTFNDTFVEILGEEHK